MRRRSTQRHDNAVMLERSVQTYWSGYTIPGGGIRHLHIHPHVELNIVEHGRMKRLLGEHALEIPPCRLVAFWGAIPHQILNLGKRARLIAAGIPLEAFLAWRLPAEFEQRLLFGDVIMSKYNAEETGDLGMLKQWRTFAGSETPSEIQPRYETVFKLEFHAALLRLALQSLKDPEFSQRNETRRKPKKFLRMLEFTCKHYQGAIRLEDIAATVHLSPRYAGRLFKQYCGRSVFQYINDLRVTHAQRLLIQTSDTVLDIALTTGFGSLSRFYEAFGETVGCSPSDFRKHHIPDYPKPKDQ